MSLGLNNCYPLA